MCFLLDFISNFRLATPVQLHFFRYGAGILGGRAFIYQGAEGGWGFWFCYVFLWFIRYWFAFVNCDLPMLSEGKTTAHPARCFVPPPRTAPR